MATDELLRYPPMSPWADKPLEQIFLFADLSRIRSMVTTQKQSLACAVLPVSDSRTPASDTSGDLSVRLLGEGRASAAREREMSVRNKYVVRRVLSDWIVDPTVQVILTSGGTGFSSKNCVPEAVLPLFDREISGFGELFRSISFQLMGTSAIQSRAVAGVANGRVIFNLPGSEDSCETAWRHIIGPQLDCTTRPLQLCYWH
ncbi:molybdopterin-binding protein [Cupriavidus basilensis]